MKNRAFLTALMLLSPLLCFSSGTYAQSRNPQQDLNVEFGGTRLSGDLVTVTGTATNNSANSYPCVHIDFTLYGPPRDAAGTLGNPMGDITVEVRDVQPRSVRKFNQWLSQRGVGTARIKSVTECSAPPDSQSVVIYENPNFGGRSKSFGIGSHRLFPTEGFNDVASSIKVPDGLVAVVYEHSDEGGGYGSWVDFLEDQPNLAKYNLDNKISHLDIFKRKRPDGNGLWVRNTIGQDGQFKPGYWYGGKMWPPITDPVVGPPIPPHVRQTPPTTCTIMGEVKYDGPSYRTEVHLFRPDGSPTQFWARVINGKYRIPNVPKGRYEIRGKGNYPTHMSPRGPTGLGIYAQGDRTVTCGEGGRADSVTFEIRSNEG